MVPNSPTVSTVPVTPPTVTKSPTLNGRRNTQENAPAREIRQQPAPGDADGDTARRQKRGERGGFHAEESQNCDDRDPIQEDR